jgi:hypothetical protein
MPVAAQRQVRERMERAARDLRAAAADEPARTAEHLLGGLAREREQENGAWRNARLDEPGDAIDERPRLPLPAPATTSTGPSSVVAAASCCGFSSSAYAMRNCASSRRGSARSV